MIKIVKKSKKKRTRTALTCPCPRCGKPSRVRRVTLGERTRTRAGRPNYVVRERHCIGSARHRFHTEERSR